MPTEALIDLRDVSLTRQQRPLLQRVSLQVQRGRIVSLIGPNGAGKTTLVKVILGLLAPDRGTVWRAPGLRVGYMPQQLALNAGMPITVKRFLAMSGAGREAIDEALRDTGIGHLRNASMHSVSGGETQRVLLARALLNNPALLVLDEPVQGVDIAGQTELYELIAQLREQRGCAVLTVSHDLHWVMAQTDHVICLNRHICCHGHPEQVSVDPEFITLFGRRHAEVIAPYQHHHDHRHDLHGEVVDSGEREHRR
jgi:zinc transport system ATP-binding protein